MLGDCHFAGCGMQAFPLTKEPLPERVDPWIFPPTAQPAAQVAATAGVAALRIQILKRRIGRCRVATVPVEEVAARADTIPYELMCGLSQRVKHRVLETDLPVESRSGSPQQTS